MERIIPIQKLTFGKYFNEYEKYGGCAEGLIEMPLPEYFKLNRKKYPIPKSLDEFSDAICYGQRIFMGQKEDEDFSIILRQIDGYYYSIVTGEEWDDKKALIFGKKVLTCRVIELYPIAMHLLSLVLEMAERERKMLHREPTTMEKLAGIDELNIFSELAALDFLRSSMNKTVEQVMLTPYNECLVRFLMAKRTIDYQERLFDRQKAEQMIKYKNQ